jgi:NADH:ubiquinone oxidoreductase subunit E
VEATIAQFPAHHRAAACLPVLDLAQREHGGKPLLLLALAALKLTTVLIQICPVSFSLFFIGTT